MEDRFHLDNFKLHEHLNRFMEYNRIEIYELSEDKITLRHEVNENSLNINGSVHGGLLTTMMDIAAGTLVRKGGNNCTTCNLNVNFLRPAKGKFVYAKGEFLKHGKRINVMHAYCVDENDVLLADAVVNMCYID